MPRMDHDLRSLDVAKVRRALAALEPPLDASAERELIAIAYGHEDAAARKAAGRLLDQHVHYATAIKRALKKCLRGLSSEDACTRLRAVERPDRGQVATALVARGINVHGVSIEEDPEFAREYIYQLLRPDDDGGGTLSKGPTLYLSERRQKVRGGYMPEYVELTRFPEVVFDELDGLRAKLAFDGVTLWGGRLATLPDRFVEMAPFLRRLTLFYNDFTSVPSVIFECDKLEELALSQFALRAVGAGITKLRALRQLSLHECKKLTVLPLEVCELSWLEELHLGFANMRSLPPEIGKLTSLRRLILQSSKVARLPAEIAGLPKLKEINIRWSKLDRTRVAELLPKVKITT
jgi:Leucine-rich repeat (LRR) protein